MTHVLIIGGGIAGLSCAFFLAENGGGKVELHEAGSRLGGLLHTVHTPWGLAEEAARAVINQPDWQAMCQGVGVDLLSGDARGGKRYIYRNGPRRWPLTILETGRAILGGVLPYLVHRRTLTPVPGQSIAAWGHRHLGRGATEYLLGPALAGIYAGRIERLNAPLIIGRLLAGRKSAKAAALPPSDSSAPSAPSDSSDGRRTGGAAPVKLVGRTVTPAGGFRDLIDRLQQHLQDRKVEIHLNSRRTLQPDDLKHPCVVATSAWQAASAIETVAPQAAARLAGVERLSLTVVCAWFERSPQDIAGFGCLFARDQGLKALGVIFNDMLFPRQEAHRSETWIFGGEHSPETLEMDDAALLQLVEEERGRLYGASSKRLGAHIKRWPAALPYYSAALETALDGLEVPENLHLTGNYVKGIGLSKIVEHSRELAERILPI